MINPLRPVIHAYSRADAALTRAVKSLVGGGMRFSGRAGYIGRQLGATSHDFARSVGDPANNGIIAATVRWCQRSYVEAPLRVMQVNSADEKTELRKHPLQVLLNKPNAWYSSRLLWSATIADFLVTGNAYWIKVRGPGRRVVELWWVPSYLIEPRWPNDGQTYISHYDYRINGLPEHYAPEDVIHFRDGLDPQNQRKGLSAVGALMREIATDNEAANMTASLLRNMGVPGVVIAPSGADQELQPEDADEIKSTWMQRFGGDRKGDPLVMSSPSTVTVLSWSPQQMNLEALRRVPEERISAALGVPAVVVGLGIGIANSTYSNYETALMAAYTGNVIPNQALFADELMAQLVPDFDTSGNLIVEHDYSDVRVLQADLDSLYKRAIDALQGGLITLNTALGMIGEPPEDGDAGDVRYISTRLTPMLADDLLALRQMPARVTVADTPGALPADPLAGVPLLAAPASEAPAEPFGGKSARAKSLVRAAFRADLADAVVAVLGDEHEGISVAEHAKTVIEQAQRIAAEAGR